MVADPDAVAVPRTISNPSRPPFRYPRRRACRSAAPAPAAARRPANPASPRRPGCRWSRRSRTASARVSPRRRKDEEYRLHAVDTAGAAGPAVEAEEAVRRPQQRQTRIRTRRRHRVRRWPGFLGSCLRLCRGSCPRRRRDRTSSSSSRIWGMG